FDRFFAEIAGEQKFIQSVWQRRGRGEGKHRIAADEDADGHALALFVITPAMARGDFLQLPVHAGGFVVVDLDAIHADVALAGVRITRHDAGQGDEAPAVERPAFQDGEVEKRLERGRLVLVFAFDFSTRGRAARAPCDVRRYRPRFFP